MKDFIDALMLYLSPYLTGVSCGKKKEQYFLPYQRALKEVARLSMRDLEESTWEKEFGHGLVQFLCNLEIRVALMETI